MGYACPVCEIPQRDGEHLAHHLAFTAMIHGDDHEAWLDDRVPDWADRDPDGLAAEVTPHAEEAEYHEVFEDTVNRGRPDVDVDTHAHDHSHGHGAGGRRAEPPDATESAGGPSADDPAVAEAVREAREMAREALGDEDGDGNENDDGEADRDA